MLTPAENEYLCRTGPDTPMGNLLRRYWLPALLCSEVPASDSPPVRVRILSEDLIAFRDTNGRVGLVANACAHRGASLFFGRNEEAGLRCVYHGWKYDVEGNCVDMPNEPAESNFKSKIRLTAYQTIECAGLVWAYLGPSERTPPFRDFISPSIPADRWIATKTPVYCNYVQSMEGNIDSAHISFLHRNFVDWTPPNDNTDRPGYPSLKMSNYIRATSRDPIIEVEETLYGFRYAAIRRTPSGHRHVRMSVQVIPTTTFVAGPLIERQLSPGLVMVPVDDENCWRFGARPAAAVGQANVFTDERGQRLRRAANDYLLDRDQQHTVSYTGIVGVANQDYAVTESMGPIYDRSREHLGTTDLAIVKMRQQLIQAARNLEQGLDPPGLEAPMPWSGLRSEERVLDDNEDWHVLATDADPKYRELVTTGR